MRRRVCEQWGIDIVVTVVDDFVAEAAIDQALATIARVEQAYSIAEPDSLVSRYNRGELAGVLSDEFSSILEEASLASGATEGWFDITRPNGTIDPSGLVKGWAVDLASRDLLAWGARNFCLDAGGDFLTRGSADGDGRPWRVGLQDPSRAGYIVGALSGYDLHVATSGTSGRTDDLWAPEGRSAVVDSFVSVTVTGPSLTWADAAATALAVSGPESFYDWFAGWEKQGYAAFGIMRDGSITSSSQWKSRRTPASGHISTTERETVD